MSGQVEDAGALPIDDEVTVCSVCNIVPLPKLSNIHCLHCFRPYVDMGNKSRIPDAASASTTEDKDTPNVMPLHMGTMFGLNYIRHTVYKLRRYVFACDVASQVNEAERLSGSLGSGGEVVHKHLEDYLREQRKATEEFMDQLRPYLSDLKGKRRRRSHWKRHSICLDTMTRKGSYKRTCVCCGEHKWDIHFEGEKHVCARCDFHRHRRMEEAIRVFIVSIIFPKGTDERPYSMLELTSSLSAIQGLLARIEKPAQAPDAQAPAEAEDSDDN